MVWVSVLLFGDHMGLRPLLYFFRNFGLGLRTSVRLTGFCPSKLMHLDGKKKKSIKKKYLQNIKTKVPNFYSLHS